MSRSKSKGTRDPGFLQELQPPKFGDADGENPRKFIEDLDDFMAIKEIPEEWRNIYFRKCIGNKILLLLLHLYFDLRPNPYSHLGILKIKLPF